MKKSRSLKPIYWLWCLLPLLVTCKKKDTLFDENVAIQVRSPFGKGEQPCGLLNIAYSDITDEQPFIISRPEEIGDFGSCSEENGNKTTLEGIDFAKEFLVGIKIYSACGFLRKQEVTLHNNKLIYSVVIENSICAANTSAYYYLLIPKEHLNFPI